MTDSLSWLAYVYLLGMVMSLATMAFVIMTRLDLSGPVAGVLMLWIVIVILALGWPATWSYIAYRLVTRR
jgi:hypothetical protein